MRRHFLDKDICVVRYFTFFVFFFGSLASSEANQIPLHHQMNYAALLRQARSLRPSSSTPNVYPREIDPAQAASSAATMPRKDCRLTCSKLGKFWTRNCFSAKTPLCSNLRMKEKADLRCISGCLEQNPLLTKNAQIHASPSFATQSTGKNTHLKKLPLTGEKANFLSNSIPPIMATFDDENLSAADKCRMEGLEGSLACQLERESHSKAERVFNDIFPKLVSSFEKSYNVKLSEGKLSENLKDQVMKSNMNISSSARTLHEDNEINPNRKINNKYRETVGNNSRRKRTLAGSYDQEICLTDYQLAKPFHAEHFYSGERVSLYFYRGQNQTNRYLQWFQVGLCNSDIPLVNFNLSELSPKCKETKIKVLADLIVDRNQTNRTQFRGCVNFDQNYDLCRDWVLMPTTCKLYFKDSAL